jgi:sugar lactone lactonase YvrE
VAFVVAALVLTVTLGTWLKAGAERSAPAASSDAAAGETPSVEGSPTPVVSHGPGSLVRIDATTGEIDARMSIPFPTLLASDDRSVWVFSERKTTTNMLVEVDATTADIIGTFDVEKPTSVAAERYFEPATTTLAAAGGSAWLGDNIAGVYHLVPGANALSPASFEVPDTGFLAIETGLPNFVGESLVGASGSLWVSWFPPGGCCSPPPDLYRVDPATDRVIAQIEDAWRVVASGTGFVWAAVNADPTETIRLVRIDTETYSTVPLGALEFPWADLIVADGAVWASSPELDTIVRLDPMTGEENERIRVEGEPGALAAGAGAVWAANRWNGTVARYDIETGRIETIDVGGTPNDLVYANGSVWVTLFGPTMAREPASGPVLLDLRTGEATPLAGSLGVGHSYVASPDGTRLAYVGTGDDGSPQIFIADIDGTVVRQMTHDLTSANWPAWSPDGTMISYEGFENGTNIFVLDVVTGESTQITDEGGYGGQYQFTPDSSSLLIPGGSSGSWVLRTLPVSGGKAMILTGPHRGLFYVGNVSLSPDGSLVTFLASAGPHGPGPQRYVANSDGTEQRSLPGCISNPAGTWSPDGSRIVCVDWDRITIIVVDIATGDATPVAEGGRAIWLDRHTLLVGA